jgi:hypothetical protein
MVCRRNERVERGAGSFVAAAAAVVVVVVVVVVVAREGRLRVEAIFV